MTQQIKGIFVKISLILGCAVLLCEYAFGQIPDNNRLTQEDVKKIKEELNLVATNIEIKGQSLLIDSALLKMRLEAEEELFPADDVYDGEWNNEFIKAYSTALIPDSFKIDVREFVMPFQGHVTSHFGVRRRRYHYGTDIKLQIGDTVVAAFDGKVRIKKDQGRRKGYGKYLVLRHPNGLETVYGHLSGYLVDLDENVKAGQPIALGGNTGRSTGSHLHFEFRFLGMPLNPEEIVDFENECTFDESYMFVKARSQKYNYASSRAKSRTQQARSKASSSSVKAAGSITYHRIEKGDTLGAIAAKHKTTVANLCRLNNISIKTKLMPGKVLRCS